MIQDHSFDPDGSYDVSTPEKQALAEPTAAQVSRVLSEGKHPRFSSRGSSGFFVARRGDVLVEHHFATITGDSEAERRALARYQKTLVDLGYGVEEIEIGGLIKHPVLLVKSAPAKPRKLTKTEEKILAKVREANDRGALCGLGTTPSELANGSSRLLSAFRFEKRLMDAGDIVWCQIARLGKGWAVRGHAIVEAK